MNEDGEVEALRSLVRLLWITQQHFVGMLQLQARRIDQVDVYFLFEWQWFCLWEQLGLRISFRKRPCAMGKDNAVGNVVAETGRAVGTTLRHDWAIFQCCWLARFDAHLNRLQGHRRQPIARSGKFGRRAYSRRALDCAYACFHRARCTKTTLLETW